MKNLLRLSKIFVVLLVVGGNINPNFCEKHQKNDFCWIEVANPHGGPNDIED